MEDGYELVKPNILREEEPRGTQSTQEWKEQAAQGEEHPGWCSSGGLQAGSPRGPVKGLRLLSKDRLCSEGGHIIPTMFIWILSGLGGTIPVALGCGQVESHDAESQDTGFSSWPFSERIVFRTFVCNVDQ